MGGGKPAAAARQTLANQHDDAAFNTEELQ